MASILTDQPYCIGLFGAGIVGGGVYEIIMGRLHQKTSSIPKNRTLRPCIITKICVSDINKPRNFKIDKELTSITTDINSIIDDESIDLVVEVIGGVKVAKTVVLECLKKGKHVVSANETLVAGFLDEITSACIKGGKKSTFAYEAALCGGIPIVQALQGAFSGDIIHEAMAICNGATNFMLGKMEDGFDYTEVLREAQALGYTGADPSTDVEGFDVKVKISILAKLAFGTTVPLESIPCMGITEISSVDFEYAKLLGCTIKLVGTAERLSEFGEHDGALSVYVSPKIISTSNVLSSTPGCRNICSLKSANLGVTSFAGPGSGKYPTANSIVADICRILSGNAFKEPFPLTSNIDLDCNYASAFYIRITFHDELGIIRRVGELAEKHGVSICSVLQNPIKDRMSADFVVTTEETKYFQVKAMCADIGREQFAHTTPIFMPMLSD